MEYTPSQWPRGGGLEEVEPSSYVPVGWSGAKGWMETDDAHADNFYRVIQVGTTMGLSASLLDSMATWGDSMWPNGDWENLVDYTPSGNTPPTASFGFDVDGLTVAFTDQSSDSDGTVAVHSWDFGDGGTSDLNDPVYSYGAAGSYTVPQTVTDIDVATATVV
jgi:PKD repeat protein